MRDMLLVLNFNDDASRAVTRKLRSERIFCKIVPGSISLEEIRSQEPLGLLLAGGVSGQMPAGLDTIDTEAFAGAAARRVIIPEGVESIGADAFSGCPNLAMVQIL